MQRGASGGDSLDVLGDPLAFGPIEGFNLVRPRLYSTRPGGPQTVTTARLTAMTPGQPVLGVIEIFRNSSSEGFQLFGTAPLGGGWTFADTYPIGDFNGSRCGEDEWHYTVYDIQPAVPVARIPASVGLGARVVLDYGACPAPNSITDWCSCALATESPVKYAAGFGVNTFAYEPIVPTDLLVTASPDTLGADAEAGLMLRLTDPHGYEVALSAADMDAGTEVTLTVPADSARGLVLGGALPAPSVTTTYGAARSGAVRYAAGPDSTLYDTPVEVSASGGGYSGSGRLVLRGTGGAGPDSLVAETARPDLACGDSTLLTLRGLLDGLDRPLPDSARVTVAVADSVHVVVSAGGVRGPTVTAAALADSTVYLVTDACDDVTGDLDVAFTVTVEAPWAEGGALTTGGVLRVRPPPPPVLRLVATPDTLAPGAEAALSLEGTVPPPETPVVLSLSDDAPGTLDGACAAPPTRTGDARSRNAVASGARAGSVLATTVGALADCRFVAAADLAEAATITITAELDGQVIMVEVTVESRVIELRLVRQNGAPVSSGYVMVSKVRPDWLLPQQDLTFDEFGGATPFANDQSGTPSFLTFHDPDTYRFELRGLPQLPDGDLVFRLDLDGQLIWTDGKEGGASQSVAEYDAVCAEETSGGAVCRSERFVRFVSNARPTQGAITPDGAYDDETAGTQTLRVGLGDQIHVSAFLQGATAGDPERELTPGGITLPVGQAPGGGSDDAVQQALLMWHVFVRDDLSTLATPDVITDRMSEDWAQASIQFWQAAPVRGVVSDGLLNTLVFTVPSRLQVGDLGTVSGEVRRGGSDYPFSVSFGPQRPTALAIAGEIVSQVNAANGPRSTAFFLKGRGGAATEVALVFDDARASVISSNNNLVEADRASPLFDLELVRPRPQIDAALVFARAVHDPANRATVGGTSVSVVNVFVAPPRAIRAASVSGEVAGLGSGDTDDKNPNTLLLSEDAADVRENLAVVAGHEVGHVLLVRDFAGSGGASHHPRDYNLMDASVEVNSSAVSLRFAGKESLGASKRLTHGQQASARCESGTGSATTLCLPNEPLGPSRLLSAPGTPTFIPTPSFQAPPTSDLRVATTPSR